MSITPDNTRADRLHEIWKKRNRRFTQAHYAYRLADEHADRVGRDHPSYPEAVRPIQRAVRRMDIIHKQCRKLARAEIAAAGLGAVLATAAPTAGAAADEWTDAQSAKAAALATLTVADWAQTRTIARHPDQWHETNPLLGRHPSVGEVDRYFIGASLIGAAALHAMPTRWRDYALTAGITIEALCVGNNLRLGIGIRF